MRLKYILDSFCSQKELGLCLSTIHCAIPGFRFVLHELPRINSACLNIKKPSSIYFFLANLFRTSNYEDILCRNRSRQKLLSMTGISEKMPPWLFSAGMKCHFGILQPRESIYQFLPMQAFSTPATCPGLRSTDLMPDLSFSTAFPAIWKDASNPARCLSTPEDPSMAYS